MRFLFFYLLMITILWFGFGRSALYYYKHRENKGIPFPADMSREDLMSLLKNHLDFPKIKGIYYDENGVISIACKYETHQVSYDNERLYVSRTAFLNPRNSRKLEEGECLQASIYKLLYPNAPINAYKQIKEMRLNRFIEKLIPVIFVVLFAIFAIHLSFGDYISSKGISISYYDEYSRTKTIGEAFDRFFDNPKWSNYEVGNTEYVDFKGECTWGGEEVEMIITFIMKGDRFKIEEIWIDDTELPSIFYSEILETIYRNE